MTQYSTETLESWVEAINETGRGLTKWEEYYVESIAFRLKCRGGLSDKQIKILERIYAERTP